VEGRVTLSERAFTVAAASDLSRSWIRSVHHGLLTWFEANRRDVPWRRNPTPYRVWVSEIMLQQTRTDTVLPYYLRWMRRFPTVHALAAADLGDVLKAWEGLGYYARARNLHASAKIVSAQLSGRLPADPDALRRLPGIGRYTANAISSIAFGHDVPVVDGNVSRVLSRLLALEGDDRSPRNQERLWAVAATLLPPGQAGTFNPALMEFGARVCTPRRPRCLECPLARDCAAYRRGDPEALPSRFSKKIPTQEVAIAILRRGDRVFVQRRPADGFLGGLWEFPGGKREAKETLDECLRRELREEVGFRGALGGEIARIRHAYSIAKVDLHAFEVPWPRGTPHPRAMEWRWAAPEDLDALAFPAANRRLIIMLQGGPPQRSTRKPRVRT